MSKQYITDGKTHIDISNLGYLSQVYETTKYTTYKIVEVRGIHPNIETKVVLRNIPDAKLNSMIIQVHNNKIIKKCKQKQ